MSLCLPPGPWRTFFGAIALIKNLEELDITTRPKARKAGALIVIRRVKPGRFGCQFPSVQLWGRSASTHTVLKYSSVCADLNLHNPGPGTHLRGDMVWKWVMGTISNRGHVLSSGQERYINAMLSASLLCCLLPRLTDGNISSWSACAPS